MTDKKDPDWKSNGSAEGKIKQFYASYGNCIATITKNCDYLTMGWDLVVQTGNQRSTMRFSNEEVKAIGHILSDATKDLNDTNL